MKSLPRRRLDERAEGIGTKAHLGCDLNNSVSETLSAEITSKSADLTLCSFAASNMFLAIGEYVMAE